MMTINNFVAGTIIDITADMFIIPNTACSIDDYFSESTRNKLYREMTAICTNNGAVYNRNDKLIQLWMCNDDNDNFQDHCTYVKSGDKHYSFRLTDVLPYTLLKDLKENDTINLMVPVKAYSVDDDDESFWFEIRLHLTAKQLDYRYRRFGSFEETLNYVA